MPSRRGIRRRAVDSNDIYNGAAGSVDDPYLYQAAVCGFNFLGSVGHTEQVLRPYHPDGFQWQSKVIRERH